jgi:hypothetical protein
MSELDAGKALGQLLIMARKGGPAASILRVPIPQPYVNAFTTGLNKFSEAFDIV